MRARALDDPGGDSVRRGFRWPEPSPISLRSAASPVNLHPHPRQGRAARHP